MITYKVIARIGFESKDFYVLRSDAYNKYFLRILEDGDAFYPTLDEYNKLDSIFNKKQRSSALCNVLSPRMSNNNNLCEKEFKLIPAIVYNGTLFILATSLILGTPYCNIKSIDEITSKPNIQQEVLLTRESLSRLKEIAESAQKNQINLDEEYQSISLLTGANIEKINTEDGRIRFYSPSDENNTQNIHRCKTIEEFGQRVGLGVENPTFDDVRDAFRRKNIPDEYKEMFIKSVDAIEEKAPNLPCHVYLYNVNKMNIIIKEGDEIEEYCRENMSLRANSCWEPEKKILWIEKGISQEDLDHENAHLAVMGQEDRIMYSLPVTIIYSEIEPTENGELVCKAKYTRIGISGDEGLAELFKADHDSNTELHYLEEAELYRIMLEISGMSREEFMMQGIAGLVEQLNAHGVNYGLSYVDMADTICEAHRYTSTDKSHITIEETAYTFDEMIVTMFSDYASSQAEKGVSEAEIMYYIQSIMDDSLLPEDRIRQLEYDVGCEVREIFNPTTELARTNGDGPEID